MYKCSILVQQPGGRAEQWPYYKAWGKRRCLFVCYDRDCLSTGYNKQHSKLLDGCARGVYGFKKIIGTIIIRICTAARCTPDTLFFFFFNNCYEYLPFGHIPNPDPRNHE